MEELKQRLKVAYELVDETCSDYVGGAPAIPAKELEVISKWIDIGIIQYAKKRKGNWQQQIYFPTIQHEAFEELSIDIWLRILRHCLVKYEIPSQIGISSANEYVSRGWDKYNIHPTPMKKSEAKVMLKGTYLQVEEATWKEILKEEEL